MANKDFISRLSEILNDAWNKNTTEENIQMFRKYFSYLDAHAQESAVTLDEFRAALKEAGIPMDSVLSLDVPKPCLFPIPADLPNPWLSSDNPGNHSLPCTVPLELLEPVHLSLRSVGFESSVVCPSELLPKDASRDEVGHLADQLKQSAAKLYSHLGNAVSRSVGYLSTNAPQSYVVAVVDRIVADNDCMDWVNTFRPVARPISLKNLYRSAWHQAEQLGLNDHSVSEASKDLRIADTSNLASLFDQ